MSDISFEQAVDFSRQHVLVFGGTTGINFGIAAAFARRHANVTVVSRDPANVQAAVAALTGAGQGAVHGACADVRDYAAVGVAIESAVGRFGAIDALVSGAAGNFLSPAEAMSANGFRAVLEIDLLGAFHVARQAFAHLKQPGSSVLHISAPQASIPMRYQAHCAAAKAGVDQLTRVLALEWGAHGIRVNAIAPGPVEGTEGFRRLMASTPEQHSASCAAVPLGRVATIADIAHLALFLSSPLASFISGAVVPCDGGGAIDSVKPALESAGLALARERLAGQQTETA